MPSQKNKNKAITKTNENENGISTVDFLNSKQKIIQKYCTSHASAKTIIRSAMLAFEESWRLQEALKTVNGRNSVYHAMLRAASTGLSLNPLEGKAALVPYSTKNKQTDKWETTVTYQIMKNGIIELALMSGKVEHISSDIVRAEDDFKILKKDTGDSFEFSPALTGRGDIVGCYASVKFKDGDSHVAYMSWDEVLEHRDKYSSSYKKDQKDQTNISPWTHSEEGMGVKTVLKKLFRNIYISPEMNKAVSSDDEAEGMQVIDVEPQKTSSPDDIAKQLTAKEAAAEVEGETIEAEVIEPSSEVKKSKAGF